MRRAGEHGLTLVEMLVVLAIVGIASGIVVLGFGAGRGVNVEAEARTLAARLRLAADVMMVGDRPVMLAWDRRGYSFVGWDAGHRRWAPAAGGLAGRHDLPAGFVLAIDGKSPALLSSDGTGQSITARISAAGRAWDVVFDGFDSAALPAPVAS